MALNKEITTKNGVIVSYHRIDSIKKINGSNSVEVIVNSYSSKEKRDIQWRIKNIVSNTMELGKRKDMLEMQESMTDEERIEHDMIDEDLTFAAEESELSDFYTLFKYTLKIDIYELNNDISFDNIYNYLKTKDENFIGATDI